MLSSQAPTIVMREGKVRVVTGSPGGRTIPNTTLWVLLGLLEFERTPREAVDALRIHHQWFPDMLDLEGDGRPASVLDDLRSRGHRVRTGRIQGDAHTIVVDAEGVIHGVADRRRKIATAAGD
jgi:gamma-glutamyltranspeptidase/glutathione hydrolase